MPRITSTLREEQYIITKHFWYTPVET